MKTVEEVKLNGHITASGRLAGAISSGIGNLSGTLSQPKGYTDYKGIYDPIPTVEGITLATKDKHMTDDVTIKPIPTYEVENEKGGVTFIIGGK